MSPSGLVFLLISAMCCCAAQQKPEIGQRCVRPDIEHGYLYYQYNYPTELGKYVEYRCGTNYLSHERSYRGTIRCLRPGWDREPKCSRECSYRKAYVENADLINLQQVILEGEKVRFRCKDNYQIPGGRKDGERTCLPDGEFTPATCSITCPAPELQNGHFSPNKLRFESGDYLQYKCNNGYMTKNRKPNSFSQCVSGGWSEPPSCIPVTCIHDNIIYKDGEVIEYKCPPGQRPRSRLGQCYYFGINPPLICQEIGCTISKQTNLIQSPAKQNYRQKDQVSFSCEQGFKMKGSSKTTCSPNGWNPPLPICEEPCKAPKIPDGKINLIKDQFESEEYLQYECNKGFMTESRNVIRIVQCLNGRWSEEPSCIPITCNYNRISYKDGDVIKYTCPQGQRPESELGQCFYYGWGPPPNCQEASDPLPGVNENQEKQKKCPFPYHPINAEIKDPKEAYYSNDNVTMTCVRGYKIHGSPTIRCIEGKWEQPPECIQNPCPQPPEVTNATVAEKNKIFNHGEIAKYECEKGFQLSGEDSASCVRGEWMNIPTCITTSCTSPPSVPNARIYGSIKPKYESGNKCYFMCSTGYSMGKSRIGSARCENTTWINLPVCRRIGAQCGPPPVIEYGDTISLINPSYNSGESVEYKCPEYYTLTGNKNVTCLNGVWDEAPVCLKPCTAREKDMEDNNIQLKSGNKKIYLVHGASLEFDCKSGYEAPPDIQMRTVCEEGKLEYPRCFRKGFCVLDQSAMITNNIQYNGNTVLENGQRFRFQCNEGMIPENNLEAKCEWSKITYPECIFTVKSCGHPGDIPFGSFKLIERDSFTFGSVVEYTCNAGYKMVSEERIRECTDNGWSGPVPRCEAVCPKPRNIKGAKLQGEWTEDAYSSGHVASFVPENSQDAPFRMACIEGTWWYISKSYYKEKLCGPPPIILYGDIVEDQKPNYTSGDSVIYKCPNYYVLKGNHVVSCLDGKWDEAPVCLEPCTVTKDHMEERNIDPKWKPDGRTIYISHGDSMEFVCKPGYKASPNPPMRVFCEQGKLEYPKCVKKA
ncbi:coagulation factor XIII B chain-like [Dendropsophus ebraccatus]|uniref:coagulation factor XIII B chain-like n=1 Tax=Dendropsophus ebraccatus TaxID=150705 RepID=UPI0038315BC0